MIIYRLSPVEAAILYQGIAYLRRQLMDNPAVRKDAPVGIDDIQHLEGVLNAQHDGMDLVRTLIRGAGK